jgi:hypothetical protein
MSNTKFMIAALQAPDPVSGVSSDPRDDGMKAGWAPECVCGDSRVFYIPRWARWSCRGCGIARPPALVVQSWGFH